MLSSVAKLADKAFIIGFLLPALVFLVCADMIYGCPGPLHRFCEPLNSQNPFANLTYFALFVWVLAVALLALNYRIFRLFEGYAPPISWFTFCTKIHQRRRRNMLAKIAELKAAGSGHDASRLKRALQADYPSSDAFVLPTRFGNRLRAFETYAFDLYGVDAVPIWPRLASVVPAAFKADIEDARSQVNFFVNLCVFALVVLAVALAAIVAALVAHAAPSKNDILIALVAAIAATGTYSLSADAVISWGDGVMSAFDCYLPALASQIGYALPDTESRRRTFWTDISKMILYRRQLPDLRWALASPPATPTAAIADRDKSSAENDAGDESDD